jgi:signal transduction histidine kinase
VSITQAVAVALAVGASFAVLDGVRRGFHSPPEYVLAVLAMTVPFVAIRRRPVPALAVMLGSSVLLTILVSPGSDLADFRYVQFLIEDLAVGVIAATQRSRITVIATVSTFGVQVALLLVDPMNNLAVTTTALTGLTVFAAALVGNSIRLRRLNAETLRARVAAEAVTAERLRIAREVHDMVAHSIAVIAIQAGVGRRVMSTQPAEAAKALDTIEVTSRETLAGLRRTLGALREGTAPLDPPPGLADLDRLASSTVDAGLRMEVEWRGLRRPVAEDIDLSAYRIVQEAVSNVVRHAGTTACRVIVDYRDRELSVEILDDGLGYADAPAGFGIVGMRERVDLLGGTFCAGPRPEGGFRVAAVLPTPSTVAVL